MRLILLIRHGSIAKADLFWSIPTKVCANEKEESFLLLGFGEFAIPSVHDFCYTLLSYYLPDFPVAVGCARVAPTVWRRGGEVLIDISSVPRSTMGAVSVPITG